MLCCYSTPNKPVPPITKYENIACTTARARHDDAPSVPLPPSALPPSPAQQQAPLIPHPHSNSPDAPTAESRPHPSHPRSVWSDRSKREDPKMWTSWSSWRWSPRSSAWSGKFVVKNESSLVMVFRVLVKKRVIFWPFGKGRARAITSPKSPARRFSSQRRPSDKTKGTSTTYKCKDAYTYVHSLWFKTDRL